MKIFEFEALKSQSKIDNDKLRGEIDEMKNEVKHTNQMKDIEIRQLTESHREEIQSTIKQIERENALTLTKLESKIKKFKHDLLNKTLEVEQASRKGAQSEEEHQQEIDNLVAEKQRLLEEISEIEIDGKEAFLKEKDRIR